MKKTTTFTRGSGCYTCRSCGRKTRDDGHGDSVNVRLCTQCFEVAGIENELSDYSGPDFERITGRTEEQAKARIEQLNKDIMEKGGHL